MCMSSCSMQTTSPTFSSLTSFISSSASSSRTQSSIPRVPIVYGKSRLQSNIYNSFRDYLFILKCKMKENPINFLGFLSVSGLYIFGYAIWVAECKMPMDWMSSSSVPVKTFSESIWLICVTITTGSSGLSKSAMATSRQRPTSAS